MKKENKTEIEKITDLLIKFRDERNWEQFHNSKDLSLALSIEAAELNELYLWKKAEDVNIERLKEELADVLIFALLLARKHKIDIRDIIMKKIGANKKKYPVKKAKNTAIKYNQL